ncbi:MAG: tetratricopeptide repeat protein [Polyangiaceae bacterium]
MPTIHPPRSPLSRAIPLLLLLLLFAAFGCASAPVRYGDRARYSPAFRGYVMAQYDGSDDPGKDAHVLVLRDPISGNKLRCQGEVEKWRELYEDVAVDAVRDDNAVVTAAVTSGAFFAPFVAMQPIGGLMLAEAMYTTEMLYNALRSADATELLQMAITLHDRKRHAQASALIERALAKDSSVGVAYNAYLYLGLSYAARGEEARARASLRAFVDRAIVRDVDGYRKAESALEDLGVKNKPCPSNGPVELRW